MSYSFHIKAADKASAVEQVKSEFERIRTSQPAHDADAEQAIAACEAFLGVIHDPAGDGEEILLNVHGSISHMGERGVKVAQIGINAQVASKLSTG